ncbi:hypothetical protein KBX71_01150 [Micromonospora sp. D93]|uniref:hypothetical protein n=1 Tax=Micromonospora sp. D93 TaxID=2824886 RepID=UPI001B39BE0D|nr:hypothetical protein [Micromonospora sp. D93]MBQ1016471.1 hypothetical protein [Micromonospora sp. D93]
MSADSRNLEIDHFRGSTGQADDEFDRLSETVASEADFLAFLEALLRDDHFTDWEGSIEGYLDGLISWLRSTEGRRRMAAYSNEFSAMAAAFYAGIAKRG